MNEENGKLKVILMIPFRYIYGVAVKVKTKVSFTETDVSRERETKRGLHSRKKYGKVRIGLCLIG